MGIAILHANWGMGDDTRQKLGNADLILWLDSQQRPPGMVHVWQFDDVTGCRCMAFSESTHVTSNKLY